MQRHPVLTATVPQLQFQQLLAAISRCRAQCCKKLVCRCSKSVISLDTSLPCAAKRFVCRCSKSVISSLTRHCQTLQAHLHCSKFVISLTRHCQMLQAHLHCSKSVITSLTHHCQMLQAHLHCNKFVISLTRHCQMLQAHLHCSKSVISLTRHCLVCSCKSVISLTHHCRVLQEVRLQLQQISDLTSLACQHSSSPGDRISM